jgi:prephenate dehydrogenase
MNEVKVGIIGGTGAMGRWFEKYFSSIGSKVLIAGRNTDVTYNDIMSDCDIIILSVPMGVAESMAADIGKQLRKDQLLTDFCSQKESIVKAMLDSTTAQVLGMHPLFGPFHDTLNGQNIVFCPGRGTKWSGWLENVFKKSGAVITHMDASTHDRNMALFQGLTHFISLCVGSMFEKLNLSPRDAMKFSTPVFRVNIYLIGRLLAQDHDLYEKLIGENKYVSELIDTFADIIKKNKKIILSGKKGEGAEFMKKLEQQYDDLCQESLEESNKMLEVLYEKKK